MPPRRLSSLLKQDTLVALLDGTADTATSQSVAAEKDAQIPASVKLFRRFAQHPKFVNKILATIDPKKVHPECVGRFAMARAKQVGGCLHVSEGITRV